MFSTTTWRRTTVWLHVLTSVGWAALAASLAVLQVLGGDPPARRRCSGPTTSTPYGFFHHRWVATKFGITLAQLYLGIGVISTRLDAAHADPAGSLPPELLPLTLLMVAAIAFQA